MQPVVQPNTDRTQPPKTNGAPPAETNGEQPIGTRGQRPADVDSHEPVTKPDADPSSEDHQVAESPWIGRWPTDDATFPADTDSGCQPAAPRHAASWSEADRLRG
jgi:hypothetical protein